MADTANLKPEKPETVAVSSKLVRQNNLIVNVNEIMVYLLIWLWLPLSGELCMHRLLYSKWLRASIIIWPHWRALVHPHMLLCPWSLSPRREYLTFCCFADVLVFAAPADCTTLPSIHVWMLEHNSFSDRQAQWCGPGRDYLQLSPANMDIRSSSGKLF